MKIGRAVDPWLRLHNYQTGDPNRAYRLEGYRFFADRYDAESMIHARLFKQRVGGEWFRLTVEEALSCLQSIP